MIHEEKTTEIEIPSQKKVISFPKTYVVKETFWSQVQDRVSPWLKEMDLEAPWILRLIAVVGILILSMLIL